MRSFVNKHHPVEFFRVFVYGTLKRGFSRHGALQHERFLGTAKTSPLYRMVNLGEYPGLLVAAPGLGKGIEGEVWEVIPATLTQLDIIEGTADSEYVRQSIQLDTTEYGIVDAYFYLGDVSGCPDCGVRWE